MHVHTNTHIKPNRNEQKNPKPNTIHILSFILKTPKKARNIYFYLSLVDIHSETNLVYVCYSVQ